MTFWEDKTVAITGGSGLIGTPMRRKLLELGVGDCLNLDIPDWDVTNFSSIFHALENADICIHLAAMSNVEQSRAAGLDAFEVNVRGTWIVLEACLQHGIGAVLVASSNHVYGKQAAFPVPETAQLNQLDTYSVSKIAADYIARAYAHNYKLPVSIIRNTNCYGPGDPHSSHIVPGTILSILRGEQPVIRSTGRTKKGYLYVDDVVDAYLMVAEAMFEGTLPYGEIYNVGAPAVDAQTVVGLIQQLMGEKGQVAILGESNDQHNEAMDSTKIEKLGWKPQHTLEEGLSKTIEWFQEHVRVKVMI